MREINECTAEVFRRSEKIIKQRKKRRQHILMACIPLVLCITVFSAFVLPAMMPAGSTDKNAAPESSNEQFSGVMGEDGEVILFAGSVEVTGNGISHSYTSVEDVQSIMGLLNGIVAVPETDDTEDFVTNESTDTSRDEAHEENGYQIVVKRSDGTITEYLLLGTMLIDQATQQTFHMDEETYFELKDALGIPLY